MKSGFWEVVHGDDRGGGRDLSAVICEAGGAELELGGPRVGRSKGSKTTGISGNAGLLELRCLTQV